MDFMEHCRSLKMPFSSLTRMGQEIKTRPVRERTEGLLEGNPVTLSFPIDPPFVIDQ